MDVFWTVFGTVISGVLVYLLGEIVKEIWLDPSRHYKEIRGKVAYALSYYGNVYTDVIDLATADMKYIEEHKRVSDELRILGCELGAIAAMRYSFSVGMPKADVLNNASGCLIGLSNSLFTPYNVPDASFDYARKNHDLAVEIRQLLSLTNNAE